MVVRVSLYGLILNGDVSESSSHRCALFWHGRDKEQKPPGRILQQADQLWGIVQTYKVYRPPHVISLMRTCMKHRVLHHMATGPNDIETITQRSIPTQAWQDPIWEELLGPWSGPKTVRYALQHLSWRSGVYPDRFSWCCSCEPWCVHWTTDYHLCLFSKELFGGFQMVVRERTVSLTMKGGRTVFSASQHRGLLERTAWRYDPYRLVYHGHMDVPRDWMWSQRITAGYRQYLHPLFRLIEATIPVSLQQWTVPRPPYVFTYDAEEPHFYKPCDA